MINVTSKSDVFGAVASGLCMVHCFATPFLFIAQTASVGSSEVTPAWWSSIDYLLLGISFIAVFRSVQTTSKTWIKYALWFSWSILAIVIFNEKLGFMHLNEGIIYIPALSLIVLHIYNRRYCQCKIDECCTT
ncbi:MAG: MerC domain-containing protein [Bacteroidota bacterium]